jgi:hypothetical protein
VGYDDNRLDKRLADILHGDHPIQGDHQQKVVEIAELIDLESAVNSMGNHRHTGDWDWGAEVTLADGEKIGDTIWSIEFVFPDEVGLRRDTFTACADADKVTHIHVEGLHWDEDKDENTDINADLPIDEITNIYWEER